MDNHENMNFIWVLLLTRMWPQSALNYGYI